MGGSRDATIHGQGGATDSSDAGDAAIAESWGDVSLLARFTVATFAGLLGEEMRVSVGDGQVTSLTLMAATPFAGDAAREDTRAPFSVLFRGPRGRILPQGTYRVEHGALGSFPLFLVPIEPDATGPRYEAVFA